MVISERLLTKLILIQKDMIPISKLETDDVLYSPFHNSVRFERLIILSDFSVHF